MIWHTGFEGAILGRGKTCFKDGAVVGLYRGPLAWQALVVGTELYRVSAGIERGRVAALHCSCPHAQKGNRCKHMAALFYQLEAQGREVLSRAHRHAWRRPAWAGRRRGGGRRGERCGPQSAGPATAYGVGPGPEAARVPEEVRREARVPGRGARALGGPAAPQRLERCQARRLPHLAGARPA